MSCSVPKPAVLLCASMRILAKFGSLLSATDRRREGSTSAPSTTCFGPPEALSADDDVPSPSNALNWLAKAENPEMSKNTKVALKLESSAFSSASGHFKYRFITTRGTYRLSTSTSYISSTAGFFVLVRKIIVPRYFAVTATLSQVYEDRYDARRS